MMVLYLRCCSMGNITRIADNARLFACSLYRTLPGAMVETPVSDLLKIVWDDLCVDDPSGLPLPPTPQYQGGQCEMVQYNVSVQYTGQYQGNPLVDTYVLSVWGQVGEVSFEIQPNGLLNTLLQCHGYTAGGYLPALVTVQRLGYQTAGVTDIYISNVTISRPDGQPDNCGNPPANYPSVTPPVGGYTSPSIPVVYNDGTDFNITVNLQPPKSVDATQPPNICLKIAIKLVEFELCFPPNALPKLGGDNVGDLEKMLREVQDQLDDLQENFDDFTTPLLPETDPSLTPIPLPGEDGGVDENTPNVKWVVVTLTKLPEKSQFGTPTVFFAGWVTFSVGGDYTVREQINFQRSVFRFPPGATGYGVTFTNMSKGNVVAYTKDVE